MDLLDEGYIATKEKPTKKEFCQKSLSDNHLKGYDGKAAINPNGKKGLCIKVICQ